MTADSGEQAHSGRAAWAARLRSWGETTQGELWLRVITAGVGVPVIVAVILVGDELLAAALSLAFAVAYLEFSHSMGLALSRPTVWIGAGGVVSMIAVALVADVPTTWPLTAAVLTLLAVPVIEELVRSHRPGREAAHLLKSFSCSSMSGDPESGRATGTNGGSWTAPQTAMAY